MTLCIHADVCVCVCVRECMLVVTVLVVFVTGVSSLSVANRKQKCLTEVDKIKKKREERRFAYPERGCAGDDCVRACMCSGYYMASYVCVVHVYTCVCVELAVVYGDFVVSYLWFLLGMVVHA